jgi:hypothetical protein
MAKQHSQIWQSGVIDRRNRRVLGDPYLATRCLWPRPLTSPRATKPCHAESGTNGGASENNANGGTRGQSRIQTAFFNERQRSVNLQGWSCNDSQDDSQAGE